MKSFLKGVPHLRCWASAVVIGLSCATLAANAAEPATRPNILFAIADDWSFPHASATGCAWVRTPAFDRVADHGILFLNAYTPNAKCAPSRASVLTGRNSWQLGPIGVHIAVWPEAGYPTFMEVLSRHGYFVGQTGKGWGPGRVENNAPRQLTGRDFSERRTAAPTKAISTVDYAANFVDFLAARKDGQPWCFWYGGQEPHRAYTFGTGQSVAGKKLTDIPKVPGFLPDNETIRHDLLDYALEVEHFDRHLGRMLEVLEARGELDNTIVVVTADNGMPFPRVKGMSYEYSNHMPLAVMWPRGIAHPGRKESSYVSFVDFAPTFLKAAGVDWASAGMQPTAGKDLLDLFTDGDRRHDRSYVLLGQERHDYGRPRNEGYPIRSIVRDGYLYINNFKPHLWPACNPETGYLNTDGSPSKTNILEMRRKGVDTRYWQLSFGKRPAEELYHLAADPDCLVNLAAVPLHGALKESLRQQLLRELTVQGDPRVVGPDGDVFDRYPFNQDTAKDFYERYMAGEIKQYQTQWVEPSDYEPAPLED